MNVTQPALSAQIRELERRLGFQLFVRTSRTVTLTPEGGLFLVKAERFVHENDWINRAARDIRDTKLRIGVAHYTSLIAKRRELIEQFIITHKQLPISIVGRSHAQLIGDLVRNEIDVAVTLQCEGAAASPVKQAVPKEIDRFVVAERKLRLLMPSSIMPAGEFWLPRDGLAGLQVATINRSHGVSLSEAILRELQRLGAVPVQAPEGDGPSVMRYAALMDMAAVDLGWFEPVAGLVSCDVEGLDLVSTLVVLARPGERREGADLFLQHLDSRP